MYSHDYSSDYIPSMPIVTLGIGLARGQVALTLPALLDSGADGTVIPVSYLDQIGALPSGERWMRGIVGGYQVDLYQVFLEIGQYGMYMTVAGDELNNEVIIGRDLLNHFIVTLNGLAGVVEITQ